MFSSCAIARGDLSGKERRRRCAARPPGTQVRYLRVLHRHNHYQVLDFQEGLPFERISSAGFTSPSPHLCDKKIRITK